MNVETIMACESIADRCHVDDPLSNQAMHEVLTEGLAALKSELQVARYRHDHALAAKLTVEITELTVLCAASADGLALQRQRFLASDRPWPLARA